MALSQKDRIRNAVKYNLQRITTANGFGTDVGDVSMISLHDDNNINYPTIDISIVERVQSSDNGGFTTSMLEKEATIELECWFKNINGISDERDQLLADIEVFFTMNPCIPDENGVATVRYCMLESSEDFGFEGTLPMGSITIKLVANYGTRLTDSTVAV